MATPIKDAASACTYGGDQGHEQSAHLANCISAFGEAFNMCVSTLHATASRKQMIRFGEIRLALKSALVILTSGLREDERMSRARLLLSTIGVTRASVRALTKHCSPTEAESGGVPLVGAGLRCTPQVGLVKITLFFFLFSWVA
jgi:hypothetical protein